MAETTESARTDAAAFWAVPVPDLFISLTTRETGLTNEEAAARLAESGRHRLHHRRTRLVLLLRQFATPITAILFAATVLSAFLGEALDAGIILAILVLSGLLSFWQENSASRAMEDLLRTVEVTVELRRAGQKVTVKAHEVVPGDIVVLDTGDLVPGDCRLLAANEALVDEAPLTGESYPAEKMPSVLADATALASRTNCVFMGTHLVRGTAEALVVRVGSETEFGQAAERLDRQVPPTSFERGISAFGGLLLRVMLVLVIFIFVVNVVLGRPLIDSFLFSLAIAVGLTPQLLPAIVSISLSLGARLMARERVIVKRLSAIEDFGAMNILCTDKTGTLTAGEVELSGAFGIDGLPNEQVLRLAVLNAAHHTGYANPIDDAILVNHASLAKAAERLDELPYDFMRKRLSVLVRAGDEHLLITKGAFENVLEVTSRAESGDPTLTPEALRSQFERLSTQGYRVLGLATKAMPGAASLQPQDESAMTFAGFLTFEDPPKNMADDTIRELASLGVSLRMVTGDNRLVARHIAKAMGLPADRLLVGGDVSNLSDEELLHRVGSVDVYAEVDPVQKERIVRAYRRAGNTVGFLGDGINDAPALHAADVGISVDTAADVAKDAASIVLLEKDLRVLMQGVRLGRQTFANTLKYVFVGTSSNFGNMASMAGASIFLPFLPLLPAQILLLNFLGDLPATTISTDRVDPEQVAKPETWDIHSIRTFMVVFGLTSSIFDFVTFGVLRLGFGASAELFRSGWFVESLMTELAVMLVLRTRRPFFRSRPGTLLLVTSGATALAGLFIVSSAFASDLGFAHPSAGILAAMAAIFCGYVTAVEIAKRWFYRRRSST